jgi:hypothetical protein
MSYVINLPNGGTLCTILDGTVNNTASSLTLVGRNYAGYGEIIAEDLVALLVNFSNSVSPTAPNVGQLWYDTSNKTLKVWTAASTWKNVGSCTSQATAPSTTVAGDLWWDSANKQLYCYDGTSPFAATGWILVGPGYSVIYGKSGAIWEQISNGTTTFDVVSMYLDGTRTAIISSSAFTPATPITGFSSIKVGYNMSTTSTAGTIWGTANNASYLGDQPAANYFRNNINNSGTGTLTILNNSGLTLGNYQVATLSTASNTLTITNNINGGNISVKATTAGVATQYLSINGVSGAVEVAADPTTVLGVTTKQYVDNRFINANLWGISTAITAPAGTSNTMIATTEFVASGLSGLFPYKIYQNNSWMWINDSGTGSANLVIDGSTVMLATATGVNLSSGATVDVATAGRGDSGDAKVASTGYVRTAGQWWGNAAHRSAKIVSTSEPNPGVNDVGSADGDFWFQIES